MPSPLRRLPVPQADPPYDDELPVPRTRAERRHGPGLVAPVDGGGESGDAGAGGQGTLALVFVLPSGVPATPVPTTPRPADGEGVAQSAPQEPGEDEDAEFAPQPTPRALLPEPARWSARLVQALVEVLSGDRPASQLVRWTTSEVYVGVQGRAVRPSGRAGDAEHRRELRAVVRSVHVSEPVDGVAEVCATVHRGWRATAVALRLEGVDGRWQCTALELP